ncbi:hypothetical protein OS493_011448 [Desmophyllum pertusum]|uniref:CARD domain-containing protein n=1 Tax=Desmophyllum pertusum TaxID=174260 RepID=A0A9W9YQC6_9CNID|nr:hypothetical protein OS493_011448 [Desmophyllum pertusum]
MAVRPSPDTPLDDKYRKMIRSNMENIIKDLEPSLLLHYMTDVLDEYDIESIRKKETRKEEARTLLDILPRRGSKAFWNFVKTLQKKTELSSVACAVWRVRCDVCGVACVMWRVSCGVCGVRCDVCHVACGVVLSTCAAWRGVYGVVGVRAWRGVCGVVSTASLRTICWLNILFNFFFSKKEKPNVYHIKSSSSFSLP